MQSPCEREDQRHVFLFGWREADDGDCGGWSGWQATGQGCVIVNIEFKEVEERVGDGGDGAVDVGFDAVLEFEGKTGLVACGEGDVF